MSGMSCRYISRCIPTSPSPTNCFSYLCLSSLRSSSTSCIQRITSVISFFFLYTTVLFPPSRPYVPTPPACRQRQRNHTRTPTLHLHSVPDQDKAAASSSLTLDNFFFSLSLRSICSNRLPDILSYTPTSTPSHIPFVSLLFRVEYISEFPNHPVKGH